MINSGHLAKKIVSNFAENLGRYQAAKSTLFNLPKENFTLRYALEMSLQDRMLYQGAAAYLMPHFDPCLDWKVFSHRYDRDKHAARTLFKPHVEAWKSFIGGVRSSLASDKVLVTTDVSNYYEHVETKLLHETFCQLLPEIKAAPETKGQIRECLDRLFEWLSKWSFSAVRGLPQNRDASSFLANVYMVPVDRAVIATVMTISGTWMTLRLSVQTFLQPDAFSNRSLLRCESEACRSMRRKRPFCLDQIRRFQNI